MDELLSKQIFDAHPEGFPPPATMICDAGQIIFSQGAPANQAFYIVEGLVEVLIEEGGHIIKLAEIGQGEFFGEMGVLSHECRMASIKTLKKSEIIILSRTALEQRIQNIEDPVVTALIAGFEKRLRTASLAQARYHKNTADFQKRLAGLMKKADEGIDPLQRDTFSLEITPLLTQIEEILHKYRRSG